MRLIYYISINLHFIRDLQDKTLITNSTSLHLNYWCLCSCGHAIDVTIQ